MKAITPQKLLKSCRQLTAGRSINVRIFNAAVLVAVCTILVKLIAFSKEAVVAWQFGAGSLIDAFIIATVVPKFIVNVVASSFNEALIPTYIRVRDQEGERAAANLLSVANLCGLVLLAITTVVIVAALPVYLPWMTLGFSPEELAITYKLFYVITPFVMVSGVSVICSAVLNAGERFVFAALVPLITPAITILLLLVSGSTLGIYTLAIGLTAGAIVEMLILGGVLYRRRAGIRPRWLGFSPAMGQVAKQYVPAVLGTLLMSGTLLVDQSMAAALSSGSVAALGYAERVNSFPLGLAATAISTVIIPYFSKMIAADDWRGVRHTFQTYLRLIFWVTVPITVLLIMFSEPLVQVLFQRGAFTSDETHTVGAVLATFALQIPFHVAAVFIVQLLISLRLNHILMWVCAFNLLINISCNYLFMQWLGVQGIALSTSFVHMFSFAYVYFFASKNLRQFSKEASG